MTLNLLFFFAGISFVSLGCLVVGGRFFLKHGLRMALEWKAFRALLAQSREDVLKNIEWPDFFDKTEETKPNPNDFEIPRDPLEKYRLSRALQGRPLGERDDFDD